MDFPIWTRVVPSSIVSELQYDRAGMTKTYLLYLLCLLPISTSTGVNVYIDPSQLGTAMRKCPIDGPPLIFGDQRLGPSPRNIQS